MLIFVTFSFTFVATADLTYTVHNSPLSQSYNIIPQFVPYEHDRLRRDVDSASAYSVSATSSSSSTTSVTPKNTANSTNITNEAESSSSIASTVVTKVPLLGVNGSGILHVNITGSSSNSPKVSDPILPDDDISDVFRWLTPDIIKAQHNLSEIITENHSFYNSSFIGNPDYFREYWANISKNQADVHELLSNSHRRATTLTLKFDFPFYGHSVPNITVATGGFIYTGDHVHNWLAATQYIAPLMANFDTKLSNDSVVKMSDDGEKFSVFWENVTLQENPTKKFTFAATLYKNGDIIFAYKDIPIIVQDINDTEHPVKVGISDAYLSDKIFFHVRRKTIYEYHRASFKNHEITNNTILKLVALPTCLQYNSCQECVNHDTGFNCTWCENIKKCSSGTDRNKQDWLIRNCERSSISNESSCPASAGETHVDPPAGGNTAYTTDTRSPHDTAVVNAVESQTPQVSKMKYPAGAGPPEEQYASPVGGVVAAFLAVTLVCCLAAWLMYAFKNPHTRSGQLLIKYRPSQWSWRRGEARYTAATIHM
ncbi:unnamed protein product, partial [Brenthis ino]